MGCAHRAPPRRTGARGRLRRTPARRARTRRLPAARPFLGGASYEPEPGRDTVVFAAQPSVPESRADRQYLLRRLVDHARRHPRREVVLKLRSKPGEHTTHIEEPPFQRLAKGMDLPPNF